MAEPAPVEDRTVVVALANLEALLIGAGLGAERAREIICDVPWTYLEPPGPAAESPARRALSADLVAELGRRIAAYEDGISWGTSCQSCAAVLDSSIRDHERAEKAEAQLAQIRADLAAVLGHASFTSAPLEPVRRLLAEAVPSRSPESCQREH